jgi:hypothetical protein
MRWRRERRHASLRLFSRRAATLRWSPALLKLLLEELWANEELFSIVGRCRRIRPGDYPHVLAVALAIRHSWRQDDLKRIANSLHIATKNL